MSEIAQIDCGYLATVQAMADEVWKDSIQKIDYVADAESARAVLDNQQVKFSEITGRKKKTISIEWQQKCDITTTSCSDDCNISGTDIEPQCKEYDIECLQETSFQVSDRTYREKTIDKQAAIATNMMLHMKELDEWLAQYLLTGIMANAGVNAFVGGVGTIVANNTLIAPNFWDDSIFGYFNRVIRGNKFKSPYMITGDNLYQLLFNRPLEAGNADGKGAIAKIGTIRQIWQDPENVEIIAPATSFLLHKTAVAFVNKAWNPIGGGSAERKAGNYMLWSEPSRNLPGVYYDIVMKETCADNDFIQAFKVQLHGMFAINPQPCDTDNTGILTFECGTV